MTKLTPKAIAAIEVILAKGDRAEVIPSPEGVKVLHIRRVIALDTSKK